MEFENLQWELHPQSLEQLFLEYHQFQLRKLQQLMVKQLAKLCQNCLKKQKQEILLTLIRNLQTSWQHLQIKGLKSTVKSYEQTQVLKNQQKRQRLRKLRRLQKLQQRLQQLKRIRQKKLRNKKLSHVIITQENWKMLILLQKKMTLSLMQLIINEMI